MKQKAAQTDLTILYTDISQSCIIVPSLFGYTCEQYISSIQGGHLIIHLHKVQVQLC